MRTNFTLAATVGACAAGPGGPEPLAPSATLDAASEPRPFAVEQPFPDEARLQELTSHPVADPSGALGDARANVERWTLGGPLPPMAGAFAFTSTDRERARAAEVIAQHGFRSTTAMMCVAHEYARFVAAHGRTPPLDIEMFMAGRCGGTVAKLQFHAVHVLEKVEPRRVLGDRAHMREVVAKFPERSHVGFGWADGEGERVFVVAGGRPDVEIEPVKLDVSKGSSVVIRGRVLWPIEWLTGHVTRGELGYDHCTPLPGIGGGEGEFGLECKVDRKDSLAFIELYAAERGALMGHPVLTLAVSPDGSAPLEYVVSALPLPVDAEDRRPEALVAGLNAVRERAKQEPLRLSTKQSSVVNHLFAYLQGQTDLDVRNEIALGIMAGWQVEGAIRDGAFKITRANHEWALERMFAGSLASPSFRAAALDPDSDIVAIGQLDSPSAGVRGVLWATYDMFEPSDFEKEEEMFLDQLDAQRASARREPVVRLDAPNDRNLLEGSARRIRNRETTPPEELRIVLQHLADTKRRNFQGLVIFPMRLEGWRPEFPPELFDAEHVAVATAITYFEPKGAAWGQHVVLLVYARLDETD